MNVSKLFTIIKIVTIKNIIALMHTIISLKQYFNYFINAHNVFEII